MAARWDASLAASETLAQLVFVLLTRSAGQRVDLPALLPALLEALGCTSALPEATAVVRCGRVGPRWTAGAGLGANVVTGLRASADGCFRP